MIRSVVVLVFTALALCGCVLQSRTPLYDDRSGELVLGQTGGAALMSIWKDGAWVRDTDPVSIAIAGQHYEATADASTIALTFVKLQTPWFVLQAVEVNKPTVYMLAEVKDQAAEVHPLACSDLKKNPAVVKWVSFEGDDCFIQPGAPVKELFGKLVKNPGEATSRLAIAN